MKQFSPALLRSKPFADLERGDCFYSPILGAWAAVFEMSDVRGRLDRFVVPLFGEHALVGRPIESMADDAYPVHAFSLIDKFNIQFDSAPYDGRSSRDIPKGTLAILKDGPHIYASVAREPHGELARMTVPMVFNLETFECEFANGGQRAMEVNFAPLIREWSLAWNAEPNLDDVFFQHPATRENLEESA